MISSQTCSDDSNPEAALLQKEEQQELQQQQQKAWEVELDSWKRLGVEAEKAIAAAQAAGLSNAEYSADGQDFTLDLAAMVQVSTCTNESHAIRCVELEHDFKDKGVRSGGEASNSEQQCAKRIETSGGQVADSDGAGQKEGIASSFPSRTSKRYKGLVKHLLSNAVQVKQPADAEPQEAWLADLDVRDLIVKLVPDVERFLYRDIPGQHSLDFMVAAYRDGITAFSGTPLHSHLLSLYRLIIHTALSEVPGSVGKLREVAESFMDCQAVQGRTIEKIGLEIQGVSMDFEGLVKSLLGNYKSMAVLFLASEDVAKGKVYSEDNNPVHYENRLIADLGGLLGLNEDDIRRAQLDEHAATRFSSLQGSKRRKAAEKCREHFDLEAFIQALAAELNSFNADSSPNSLPRQFLDWWNGTVSSENKHIIFAEDDYQHLNVERPLALAIVEILFRGRPHAPREEVYRDAHLRGLCGTPDEVDEGDEEDREGEAEEAISGEEDHDSHEDCAESCSDSDEESSDEDGGCSDGGGEAEERAPAPMRPSRLEALVLHLLSDAVQVKQPEDAEIQEAFLTDAEVHDLIVKLVPGVKNFLYRDIVGQHSLDFMVSVYRDGIRAFVGTPLHSHILSLYRLIIHTALSEVPGSAGKLREVAEAFMDCQAVQGRTIEKIGLEIQGVSLDFQGLVTSLLGNYKGMALMSLAAEDIERGKVYSEDNNPVHYENRLIADLGDVLGLNQDDIRRARHDEHASSRFRRLEGLKREKAADRCRELFDVDAFLQALAAELNSFNADSPPNSLPRQFLDWWNDTAASEHKHIIFAEDDFQRLEIERPLALAIVEVLYLGRTHANSDEVYREMLMSNLCGSASPEAETESEEADEEASSQAVEGSTLSCAAS